MPREGFANELFGGAEFGEDTIGSDGAAGTEVDNCWCASVPGSFSFCRTDLAARAKHRETLMLSLAEVSIYSMSCSPAKARARSTGTIRDSAKSVFAPARIRTCAGALESMSKSEMASASAKDSAEVQSYRTTLAEAPEAHTGINERKRGSADTSHNESEMTRLSVGRRVAKEYLADVADLSCRSSSPDEESEKETSESTRMSDDLPELAGPNTAISTSEELEEFISASTFARGKFCF